MKNTSRLKKAYYNIIVLALYQITIFICNLILPRMILGAYGSEYNGIISSVTQLLNFISILRIGVAGATRVELYKSLAKNDNNQTSAIIRATEKFMRKIALVFIIYLLILAIFYPIMIENSFKWLELFLLIVAIGIGIFAQYFFGITYSTLLQADQKLYIYNIIQIFGVISNTIISFILIKLGNSIQLVKFASAIVFTATPIILNIYVRKCYKLDKNVEPDNTALKNRNDVVGHSIANIVHENTDVIVLTFFTNVKLVSVYSVYHLVINGLKLLMEIFISGLESVFGDMWVKREDDKIKRYLDLYEYFMALFISVIYTSAYLLIVEFVKLYTNNIQDANYIIPIYAYIALTAQICYCMRMPYLTLIHAAGKYKETKNSAFAEAIINIIISCVTVNFIGIYGVALGTLIANIYRTIYYEWFCTKELVPRDKTVFYKKIIWIIINLLVSITISACCFHLIYNSVESWGTWIIFGIISVIVSIIVAFVSSLIFYRNNLKMFIDLIRKILKSNK